MAIGIISRPEGITKEIYDAIQAQLDLEGNPADGLLVHSAGELDGRFQVWNIWESTAHFERFRSERLRPALIAVIGEERAAAMGDPENIEFELHNLVIPR